MNFGYEFSLLTKENINDAKQLLQIIKTYSFGFTTYCYTYYSKHDYVELDLDSEYVEFKFKSLIATCYYYTNSCKIHDITFYDNNGLPIVTITTESLMKYLSIKI